ncbi:MAG: hypothetical protein ABJF23_12065 [Bryobacteraceae bacterium]
MRVLPEFSRPDPVNGIVAIDSPGSKSADAVHITAARAGYASFHLVAKLDRPSEYEISLDFPLPADAYREWFHFNTPDQKYYPDALIPVTSPYRSRLPEPDNRIPGQTAQAFWIDIWIPASTAPRLYRGEARLTSGSERKTIPIEITVLSTVIPDKDAVTLDSNSYGTSWLQEQYPKTLADLAENSDPLYKLIHQYHRIFYDHRGTFHQLGYGHAGKVGPEFAPELTGTGTGKHVSSWTNFDRHYGPLFDGSAFKDSRRGPSPIPYVYLPINPDWPASFLWWGEPGYEAEFVNVVSEMERHFREKNWTSTRMEVFFNHKKRYKGFPWDGDEIRFERDNQYLLDYRRLLDKAVPATSPVQFVMRSDSSWTMEQQFELLKGVIKFWVVGEGSFSWYPGAAKRLKDRGDTIWTYGGTPTVQSISTEITLNPLRSWITGVDGFVRWLTISPGPDPWYHFGGGGEVLVYSGERFGRPEPLASIRLKLQRNCLQDLALLEAASQKGSREQIQQEVVKRYNGTRLADWHNTRPALLSKPVLEWNNADFDDALKPYEARFKNLDPASWQRVRDYALTLEAK